MGKLENLLGKFGVERLYHITAMQNIRTILQHGLLSRELATEMGLIRVDIANQDVIRKRRGIHPGWKLPKCADENRSLLHYVPLFFARSNTPMEYVVVRDGMPSQDIVRFELDAIRVFRLDGVIFTDGNAASNATSFFTNLKDLEQLDWNVIKYRSTCTSQKSKRLKTAEVLVPDRLPGRCAVSINVRDAAAKKRLQAIARRLEKHYAERSKPWLLYRLNSILRYDLEGVEW
ncbi:DUF4433 domain-containing protein [bacterium]|nr:DUF4433 domain-containing protein [bacterium]